jgi:hypothetical protein
VASSYTDLLKLVLPVTGELTNVWGSTVNTDLTQFVENAIAGTQTNSVAAGNWTLTTEQPGNTNASSTNSARYAILIATGAPATTRYIYAPKQSKTYVVINNCSDSSLVYISGGPTAPTTGVSIAAGSSALVAWDSTTSDFVKIAGGGSGGATGGGTDQIFYQNGLNVTTSYTITTNNNAGTFGPVTIDAGATVTVPDGSVWTVV